jgi:hypothetical protein
MKYQIKEKPNVNINSSIATIQAAKIKQPLEVHSFSQKQNHGSSFTILHCPQKY